MSAWGRGSAVMCMYIRSSQMHWMALVPNKKIFTPPPASLDLPPCLFEADLVISSGSQRDSSLPSRGEHAKKRSLRQRLERGYTQQLQLPQLHTIMTTLATSNWTRAYALQFTTLQDILFTYVFQNHSNMTGTANFVGASPSPKLACLSTIFCISPSKR